MIGIIDYGIGNITSDKFNTLVWRKFIVTNKISELKKCETIKCCGKTFQTAMKSTDLMLSTNFYSP